MEYFFWDLEIWKNFITLSEKKPPLNSLNFFLFRRPHDPMMWTNWCRVDTKHWSYKNVIRTGSLPEKTFSFEKLQEVLWFYLTRNCVYILDILFIGDGFVARFVTRTTGLCQYLITLNNNIQRRTISVNSFLLWWWFHRLKTLVFQNKYYSQTDIYWPVITKRIRLNL